MITGIDLKAVVDYTLKDDIENPTIWKLGMIPTFVIGQIGTDAQDINQRMNVLYKVLQFGIKGWDNFDVPYAKENITLGNKVFEVTPLEAIMRLPLSVMAELSQKIFEINHLTEIDKKN